MSVDIDDIDDSFHRHISKIVVLYDLSIIDTYMIWKVNDILTITKKVDQTFLQANFPKISETMPYEWSHHRGIASVV